MERLRVENAKKMLIQMQERLEIVKLQNRITESGRKWAEMGKYFPYITVNKELRALCPPLDHAGQIITWRKKRYFLAWHTGFGVFIKRIKDSPVRSSYKPS